jgi:hypothetical protein
MTGVEVVTASSGDVDCLPRTTRPGYRAASRYQRAIGQ